MTLSPAPAGQGVVFVRGDLGGAQIPARYDLVGETRLGTVLEQDGVQRRRGRASDGGGGGRGD